MDIETIKQNPGDGEFILTLLHYRNSGALINEKTTVEDVTREELQKEFDDVKASFPRLEYRAEYLLNGCIKYSAKVPYIATYIIAHGVFIPY